MVDTTCQWNQTGTMLVIAGLTSSRGEHLDVLVNVVQCFSPMGDHLRTLKVPGNSLPRMLVLYQELGQLMLDPRFLPGKGWLQSNVTFNFYAKLRRLYIHNGPSPFGLSGLKLQVAGVVGIHC